MAVLTMALLSTALLTMALLSTALLTMAILTTALLIMAVLTMALLSTALLTMALLTTALLTMGQAVIDHAEATLEGGEGKGDLEVPWLDLILPLALQTYLQTYAGSLSLRQLEP